MTNKLEHKIRADSAIRLQRRVYCRGVHVYFLLLFVLKMSVNSNISKVRNCDSKKGEGKSKLPDRLKLTM